MILGDLASAVHNIGAGFLHMALDRFLPQPVPNPSAARITVRPGTRRVGVCGKCGETVLLARAGRVASCAKGCTVVRLPVPRSAC
jgi:hypothetical protein